MSDFNAEEDFKRYVVRHNEAQEWAEDRLFNFFVKAWPTMEQRFPLETNWHLGLAAEYLEALYLGEIEKLVINWPTRYLKSKVCSIAFPAWAWTQDARKKFIHWSYSGDISTAISWERRLLIESKWYKTYWGDKVRLKDDQNQKTRYANTRGGSMFSTSTGGAMTGEGCDIMMIDDPQNPQQAASDTQRMNSINFWTDTASSRFDNKKRKSVCLVMQRLHEKDLTGYFLSEYENAVHLRIPNICEERTVYSYPRTGRIKIYEEGEILQPNREGPKELEEAKKELGSYNFAAQRQQRPVPRGGGMVKESWFKFYRERPAHFDSISLSLDCTFKDLESSDYVVLQAWGELKTDHYLLQQLRAKLSFRKTKDALIHFANLYPKYLEALIEDKANGTAIIDVLKDVLPALIAVEPIGSKVERLAACEPMIEAGNVWLPDPDLNPWVRTEFIPEIITFPKGEYADQVDAMTQYLNRARSRKVGAFSQTDEQYANYSGGTFAGSLT